MTDQPITPIRSAQPVDPAKVKSAMELPSRKDPMPPKKHRVDYAAEAITRSKKEMRSERARKAAKKAWATRRAKAKPVVDKHKMLDRVDDTVFAAFTSILTTLRELSPEQREQVMFALAQVG